MGSIKLKNVTKSFGETEVIPPIDLEINDGEFLVFVGPSGCGKSTLLRLIAGLEDVTGGQIEIDGRDATAIPPAKRGLAMVFQSYALYPHMSVRKNIAFPLKMAGLDKAEIERRVVTAGKILNLTDYLHRRPGQLSGGQRQRVAIGRAIVREPSAFLFDEPLSNLDAALRVNMRLEISDLHHTLKTTMIYVTHDQIEAMTMADKIVVLNAGRIEQVGSPLELYRNPRNLFVAGFIGSPKMNFITGDGYRMYDLLPQPGVEHGQHQVEHQELHRVFVELDQPPIYLDIKAIRLQLAINRSQLFATVLRIIQRLLQADLEGIESGVIDQLGIRAPFSQLSDQRFITQTAGNHKRCLVEGIAKIDAILICLTQYRIKVFQIIGHIVLFFQKL